MCQQLGVFHKQESYCVDDFISAIPKEILHFNFNLNTHNSSTICVLKSNVNYLLPLDKNIEELRANYSQSHLKNLRRANKNNLSIATVPDSAEQFSKNKRLLASSFMNSKQFDLALKKMKEMKEQEAQLAAHEEELGRRKSQNNDNIRTHK